jgi:hypothetical protein
VPREHPPRESDVGVPLPDVTLHPQFFHSLHSTIPNQYTEVEKRIIQACEAAKCEKKPNIAALARQFDVYKDRDPLLGDPSLLSHTLADILTSAIIYSIVIHIY